MDQQARRPVLAPCRLSTLPMISVSTPQQPSRPPDGQLIAESPLISAFGHGGSVRDGNFFFKPRPKAGDRYQNEKRLLSLLGGCGGGGAGNGSGVHEAAPAGCAGGGAGPSDPMAQFVPRYFGEVQLDGCWFFQMEDLLRSFSRVHMADIKMGVRCFSEDEVQNERPRPDLFDRMERLETMLGTPVLTAAERQAGAMTKARWMTLRDSLSSTRELGFRIDALLTPQGHDTAFDSSLFRTRTRAEVSRALRRFFPRQAHCTHGAHPRLVAAAALRRVRELECALRQSEVFATHELIGTTLLLVADETGRFGAWMIDFGVTLGGARLRHDVPWVEGNREDGYLIGVRNLIVLLERIVQEDDWD